MDCIVIMDVFIDFMVAIIGGMIRTIFGIRVSSLSMSTTICARSSLSASIPSRLSNTDRIAKQIGMSKQCGSQ